MASIPRQQWNAAYVGETGRTLEIKLKEPKREF